MSDTQWAVEGECPECGGKRLATDGKNEWCMECLYSSESDSKPMNETQAEHDTYPDTFPQPLVQRYVSENGTDIQLVEDRPGGEEVAVVCSEYADLLATAAGAAREAKEMGCDPQEAVQALPELLEAVDSNGPVAKALCALKEAADFIEVETDSALGAGRLHRFADEAADSVGLEINNALDSAEGGDDE